MHMKKSIRNKAGVFALSLVAFAAPVYSMAPGTASAGEHTQMALGLDLAAQLPVGNFADVAGFGLGALGRFEYQLNESALGLTARAGYLMHLDKDVGPATSSFSQIPLLAGVKYSLPTAPIYIAGELGAVIAQTRLEGGPGPDTDESETNVGFTAGAGYELGDVDIRMSLNFLDVSNMADAMAIGVTFGYNFWGK
jgi:opacity protein-like surface antigen